MTGQQVEIVEQDESETHSEYELTCLICITSLDPNSPSFSSTTCNHGYHLQCIQEWLKQKTNCPACRSELTYFTNNQHGKINVQPIKQHCLFQQMLNERIRDELFFFDFLFVDDQLTSQIQIAATQYYYLSYSRFIEYLTRTAELWHQQADSISSDIRTQRTGRVGRDIHQLQYFQDQQQLIEIQENQTRRPQIYYIQKKKDDCIRWRIKDKVGMKIKQKKQKKHEKISIKYENRVKKQNKQKKGRQNSR